MGVTRGSRRKTAVCQIGKYALQPSSQIAQSWLEGLKTEKAFRDCFGCS